jgi:hypothetical protein
MRTLLAATALLAISGLTSIAAIADHARDTDHNRNDRVTVAVFGDWPYNQLLLDNASLLLDSINADSDVSLVIHVGDIHSGSMPCTSAAILPPIPASNPGWNQRIYYQFQQFKFPVVYTSGDNEWADCHKTKQFASGAPLKELASVRACSSPGPVTRWAERTSKCGARQPRSIPLIPTMRSLSRT